MTIVSSRKKELRRELKAARDNIENDRRIACDARISEYFLKSNTFRLTDSLLIYCSVGSEISTMQITEAALQRKIRVYLPRCVKDNIGNDMLIFHRIGAMSDLKSGAYNIPEPLSDLPTFEHKGHCVCVVPGLAFDKTGYRIGYGKGYYDRFLKDFNGTKIGLCRHDFLKDALPVNEFDHKVDMIITEKGIIVPHA